ncbi:MAG: type II toxin-antitoxin system VapC family toxin [Planctomycetales bacterium]|nr:type II toxin-antitoxin system VapC family toxin [Planctomycetales bacterium]
MIFWDTSGLVKAYLPGEADHARAKNLLVGREAHVGSLLLRPEARSAIVRRLGADRVLRDQLLGLLDRQTRRFRLVPLEDEQAESAERLIERHSLRGADGVHLAAALQLAREAGRSRLRLVTADADQARAARAEGLRVVELAR